MEVFVPLSSGFPSQLTTGKRLFPVHKSAVNVSINLNTFPELRRFTEKETCYQIAAIYTTIVVTD